jgi:hypothetical protein
MNYAPSQLPDIDVVELVDFRGLPPTIVDGSGVIPKNVPYVRIKKETAQKIAYLWRQLPPGEQMRCHYPPFGLRFYMGNKLLVQGSVCWECNNIFAQENGKKMIYEFYAQHPHSRQLFALLQHIVMQFG